MRILALTRYDATGASSRYRTYQYLPKLRQQGFDITVAPLLDETYLARRYAGDPANWLQVGSSYARRIGAMVTSRRFDLVWIEKEALPWVPGWFERLLTRVGAPYVVDYDDAIFHAYDRHRSPIIRRSLGAKIERVMRGAVLVTAGNQYLADYARTAGARRVEVLPTVVDLDRYDDTSRSSTAGDRVFTIGWIGTPITARYLDHVRPALREICAEGQARVVAIGAGALSWPDVPLEVRTWSAATEVADLQEIDVGIMPLPDSPWERGKCGLKLIQYMACARPVVASPVGVNKDIVVEGVTGYQATGLDDWACALRSLQGDAELRQRMGIAGRSLVEEQFSLQVTAPHLAGLLRGVL